MKWAALLVAAVGLAGCDDLLNKNTPPTVQCFSITPNTGNQPFSPILVDACEGKSWLLVRSRMGDKPEDGYTYHWMALEKFDYTNPVLVSGQ